MIRINLLPVREVEQASSQRKELILAGGCIAVTLAAILLVHFFQTAQAASVNSELTRLEGLIAKIREQNQELEKAKQQKKELEEKNQVVRRLTSPERRAASVHILDDLSASTPEHLWLTEYAESKGAAQIRGKAIDNQTIASFARSLTSSQYFQKVEIRETLQEAPPTNSRGGTDRSRVNNAPASSPVLMTKFLIEAAVRYNPSVETLAPLEDKGKAEGKEQKGGETKPAKKAVSAVSQEG